MFMTTCWAYEDLELNVRPADHTLHIGLLCANRDSHLNVTLSRDQAIHLITVLYTALQSPTIASMQEQEVA